MKDPTGTITFHTESLLHRYQHTFLAGVASIALFVTAVACASDLTGTWGGALTQGNDTFDVEWTFSEAGYFVLAYTNNKGQTRSVELATPGQKIQYVPSGGGVRTHVVDSLARQPGRLSFVIRTTFERASGGYLDQQYTAESFDFRLTAEGLATQLVTQSNSHFGDEDLSTGGADESVASGVLQKVGGSLQDTDSDENGKLRQEMQDLSEQQKRLTEELDALDKQARDAIQSIRAD